MIASRAQPHATVPRILSLCVVLPARTFHYTYSLTPLPFAISRTRALSSLSKPPPSPPAERAVEIIDKLLSHPSLITATGVDILGSGLLATAISQELSVFDEETVIAAILFAYIAKVCRVFFPSRRLFLQSLFRPPISDCPWNRKRTPLFLLVALFRECRDRMDADRNLSHA